MNIAEEISILLIGHVKTGHLMFFKNRFAPVGTNRLLKLCVDRSPIQLRTGLRLNTLDQLKLVLIKHVPSSGS